MPRQTYRITFEGLQPRHDLIQQAAIEQSVDKRTTTCRVTIPRVQTMDNEPIDSLFSIGQGVSIEVGWGLENYVVFKGYIARIQPSTPIVLHLEDEMWQLKQQTFSKNFDNADLSDILALLGITNFNAPDAFPMGKFRISKSNGAKVLDTIAKQYATRSFFKIVDDAPQLQIKNIYDPATVWPVIYGQNWIDPDNLEFVSTESRKVRILAKNLKFPSNQVEEYTTGPEGGDEITKTYWNQPNFKALADQELEKMSFGGYEGSTQIFGDLRVQAGEVVRITDRRYPERAGTYFVDAVTIQLGKSAYFRTLKLGAKA